jgi:AcrR family transcriptional regulator
LPKHSSKGPGTTPRRSREITTARILYAAEELFSARDPSGVTVRQIAEKAGVTHALVHQYLGSKDQILNAVIVRAAPDRQQTILGHSEFREVMPILFADVVARKIHTRSVIRSAMDGVEYTSLKDRIDTGVVMIEFAKRSVAAGATRLPPPAAMDPRIVAAAATALAYGWVALQDWLVQICDLTDEDPAEVQRQLGEVVGLISDLAYPLAAQPVSGQPGGG